MKNKNTIILYHYSKRYIPDKINPLYFGDNSYTKRELKTCSLKRCFYYLQDDYIPEYYLKDYKYKYIVKIKKSSIYDLRSDKLNLIDKFNYNIPKLLTYIKNHYKGCIYNIGYDVVILFYPVKYKEVIKKEIKMKQHNTLQWIDKYKKLGYRLSTYVYYK